MAAGHFSPPSLEGVATATVRAHRFPPSPDACDGVGGHTGPLAVLLCLNEGDEGGEVCLLLDLAHNERLYPGRLAPSQGPPSPLCQ